MGFAQNAEGVETPLATHQVVADLAIGTRALGDGDGFFEANAADVVHNLFKNLHVAVARVEHFNAADGHQGDRFRGAGHHGLAPRVAWGCDGQRLKIIRSSLGLVVVNWHGDLSVLKPVQAFALRHAIEEVQVVKAKTLKIGAVAIADPDFLLGQVQLG